MAAALARSPRQMGRLIQQARQRQGLNQTELARLAGLRQEMVSKVETGQPGVKLATVCDLLAALGLELTVAPRTASSAADIADIF